MTPGSSARERILTVGWNTGYQIGSQTVPAIAAIVAIPFLLRRMGAEVFGIMTIFSTALAYFTMLDLGLGRAATRFIARSLEAEKPDEVRRYFWGSILLLNVVGILAMGGAALAVPIIVSRLLKIPPSYVRATSESLYIICLTIPVVTLMATFRGLLEAAGRFRFISVVAAFGGGALYVLPALAVSIGGGLVSVAVALALARVAMCGGLAYGCLSGKERYRLQPIFDAEAVKRMLSFGGWLSVSNIVGAATIYADRLLLGASAGMVAVSSYSVPLDVIARLQILVTSLCAVLFPLMSRLDGPGSDEFQTVYRGATATVLCVMTVIATTAVLAAPMTMKLWLGTRCTADSVFAAQIFLAGALVQSMASIAWTGLHAKGRSDLTAWVHVAEFPVYVAAFYMAASYYGVRGAALAWLGRAVVDFLCMCFLLRQERPAMKSAVPPEALAVLVSGSILALAMLPLSKAAPAALLICVLSCLWAWRVLLDGAMRIHILQAIFGRHDPRPAC